MGDHTPHVADAWKSTVETTYLVGLSTDMALTDKSPKALVSVQILFNVFNPNMKSFLWNLHKEFIQNVLPNIQKVTLVGKLVLQISSVTPALKFDLQYSDIFRFALNPKGEITKMNFQFNETSFSITYDEPWFPFITKKSQDDRYPKITLSYSA